MKLNPAVQDVPEVKLPKTNMSDVLFDNIYTELQQHGASAASSGTGSDVELQIRYRPVCKV